MAILTDEHFVGRFAEQVADIVETKRRLVKLETDAVMLTKKVQLLEEKVELLESDADKREQYTRRPNLWFSGIDKAVN